MVKLAVDVNRWRTLRTAPLKRLLINMIAELARVWGCTSICLTCYPDSACYHHQYNMASLSSMSDRMRFNSPSIFTRACTSENHCLGYGAEIRPSALLACSFFEIGPAPAIRSDPPPCFLGPSIYLSRYSQNSPFQDGSSAKAWSSKSCRHR